MTDPDMGAPGSERQRRAFVNSGHNPSSAESATGMQGHLQLIPHTVQGEVIYQRPNDGYINATAMCKAAGKKWFDYARLSSTGPFVAELSSVAGIPATELIQSVSGGTPQFQGTWVHPQIATHLAQWLSPKFAVLVSKWVMEWLSGAPKRAELPYHIRRHLANQNSVPIGHFSVMAEMTIMLIGPLEAMGYSIPERMLPDISMGRVFCAWLRLKHGIDTNDLPSYLHTFEDGRRVIAKAYPDRLLADFRRYFREEWLQIRAVEYFRERDSEALAYLPRLLAGPRAA